MTKQSKRPGRPSTGSAARHSNSKGLTWPDLLRALHLFCLLGMTAHTRRASRLAVRTVAVSEQPANRGGRLGLGCGAFPSAARRQKRSLAAPLCRTRT